VSTLVTERFGAPTSVRVARAQSFARSRAVDELAGRTVWFATALPEGEASARELQASLAWAGADGVAAAWLDVGGDVPLREAAQRLDTRLAGTAGAAAPAPRAADRDCYAEGVDSGESLVGDDVRPDDVVVLHDALTTVLVQAIRERGAHAVWHVRVPAGEHAAAVEDALGFLRDYTNGVGAYVLSWTEPAGAEPAGQRIAALIPALGVLSDKHAAPAPGAAGPAAGELAWGCLLGEIVHADRGEMVGGRMHARPTVAPR
jgi:hypothetical protein